MNLPNSLTISRFLAIPLVLLCLLLNFPLHYQLAAIIFLIAAGTDMADGYLARRRREVTEGGKFLDPLADKLLVISVLVAMVQLDLLAAWVVIIIFSRELLITALRALRFEQGVIAASAWGKLKTTTQNLAIILLILSPSYPALYLPGEVLIVLAVLLTLFSGADYLWRFRSFWLGNQKEEPSIAVLGATGTSVAVAESCTGGLLAAALTEVPGSSKWFKGGVVSYSSQLKQDLLGVSGQTLERFGAVSAETAKEMAEGIRRQAASDIGIAVTGIAGPDSDESGKPVGLVHLWLASAMGGSGRELHLNGDRQQNQQSAVQKALALLMEHVVSCHSSNVRSC